MLSKAANSSAVSRDRREDELHWYHQHLSALVLLLNAGSPLWLSLFTTLRLYLSYFNADSNRYCWRDGPM